MRLIPALLLTTLLALPGSLQAQEENPFDVPEDPAVPGQPDPEPGEDDASTPLFLDAMASWRKDKWRSAQKKFKKLLKKYPKSMHAAEAEILGGDNCYLGIEPMHVSGPPSRRVDVCVMGDGFLIGSKGQKKAGDWAKLVVKVLYSEDAYDEYRNYFNYYFVRLASFHEGVDEKYTDEEKEKIRKRNKRRKKKKIIDHNTAVDCKAAPGGGQVYSDRGLVYKWLNIADEDIPGAGGDGLVIVFAQFGKLGMAGGGIANCGHPDNSVTVHEFGHAFALLLDEYANNPGAPRRPIFAPNASTTDDPEKVPWAHFLKKKVKGVGIYLGGATFKKGVWRPAAGGCAMNSAGSSGYCPVCREQTVLTIYSTVNPIDKVEPDPETEITLTEKDKQFITVTPMQPKKKKLKVNWFVEKVEGDDEGPVALPADPAQPFYGNQGQNVRRYIGGARRLDTARAAALEKEPEGDLSRHSKVVKGKRGKPTVSQFKLERLPPGRYKITAQVKDETKWVIKDPKHLLEERATWWVTVRPKPPKSKPKSE